MAINPKEKKMLQEMWNGADDASGADIADGTYQFKILSARFHMTDKNKPTFKTKVKITGGDEEYVGKELELNDNLETAQNMGFFKKKLRRLNITVTEDFDDIVDGAVAEEMIGKTFEGQVKMKNDFLNVYVNRLVSDGGAEDADEKPKKKASEEEDEEKPKAKKAAFEEGDKVTWGDGKEGEIVEVLEDEGKARVQKEDETIVRVSLDALEKAEKKSSKKKDEEEEEEDGGKKKKEDDALELPSPEDVDGMKAGKVRETLEALGFEDADDLKDPRGVLHAFSTLAEDPEAKIALTEVKPLADALEVELDKSEPMKAQLKQLAKAVAKRLA